MTDKQNIFKVEILKDFNATRAAIAAGYSEKTAYSIGNELLRKPEVREAIRDYIDNEIGMTEKIIIENIRFWEKIRNDPEAGEAARLKASEHLGKYTDMFKDHLELTGNEEKPLTVKMVNLADVVNGNKSKS